MIGSRFYNLVKHLDVRSILETSCLKVASDTNHAVGSIKFRHISRLENDVSSFVLIIHAMPYLALIINCLNETSSTDRFAVS